MPITYEPLNKQSFEFVRDVLLGSYLDGMCYEFAFAIRESDTGEKRPMIGIMHGGTIRHVVVKLGEDKYFDARGSILKKEIGEPFGIPESELVLQEVSEEDIRKVRPVDDFSVERAKWIINAAWPDFPIKGGVLFQMKAFAEELEALSRKHGIWIRAPYPTAMPILSFGDELEDGYVITPTANSPSYLIDRVLNNKNR